MRGFILTLAFTCISSLSFSQIHEVGVFAGGSNYIGDIGRTNYIYPNEFAGGLVYKYNLNPRIALRGTLSVLPISADDINSGNSYRENRQPAQLQFSNTITELAAGIEFNFFDYNIRVPSQYYTPYILAEIAVINYKTPSSVTTLGTGITQIDLKNTFSPSIPLGIGFKGRLSDHLAFAIESGVRLTFSDDLDYSTQEFESLDFVGNGNDFYTFTGFSIVYSFGRPACYDDTE